MTSARGALARDTFGLGRSAAASVLIDVLIALVNIFVTRGLVSRLGVEPYGILGIVTVLSGQMLILQFGVGQALTRRLAECRGRHDAAEAERTRHAGFAISLASAVILGVVFASAAPVAWARAVNATPAVMAEAARCIPLAAAVVAAQPMLVAMYGALFGDERFLTASLCRFVHGVVRLLVPLVLVIGGGGVAAVLMGQLAVDWTLVAAWRATLGRARAATRAERLATARGLLGLGIPFALAAVVAAMLYDGEKIGITAFRSVAEFTLYAVPFGAAVRFTLFGAAVTQFLVPRLTSVLASGRDAEGARLCAQATRMTTASTALVLLPVIALAPDLVTLWLGANFGSQAGLSTRLVLLGVVLLAAYSGAASVVRARVRPTRLLALYLAELPVFAALVVELVPRYGIAGAGAAWSARVACDGIAQSVIASRIMGRPVGRWAVLAAPALALFLVVAFAAPALDSHPGFRGLIGMCLGVVAALVVLERDDWDALRRALWRAPAEARS